MPEETNPNPETEANPVVVPEANPDTGSQTEQTPEPGVSPEAESPTAEQIEEWRKGYESNANTQAEYTRGQQSLREAEKLRDQYAEANSVLMGREQQRVDPIAAIDARLAEYPDAQTEQQLRMQRDQVLIQRAKDAAVAEAMTAWDTRAALDGADPNELVRLEQSMTPAQRVAMLKREQAAQSGTLYDQMTAERTAKERAAQNAARLNTPMGEGASPGVVSGGAQTAPKSMSDITFYMLPKSRQQEVLDAGWTVHDNSGATIQSP